MHSMGSRAQRHEVGGSRQAEAGAALTSGTPPSVPRPPVPQAPRAAIPCATPPTSAPSRCGPVQGCKCGGVVMGSRGWLLCRCSAGALQVQQGIYLLEDRWLAMKQRATGLGSVPRSKASRDPSPVPLCPGLPFSPLFHWPAWPAPALRFDPPALAPCVPEHGGEGRGVEDEQVQQHRHADGRQQPGVAPGRQAQQAAVLCRGVAGMKQSAQRGGR